MPLPLFARRICLKKFTSLAAVALLLGAFSFVGLRTLHPSSALSVGKAGLSMAPASGPAVNGATIPVAITVNSGTTPVSTVRAYITYPASQLQFVSIANGAAFTTAQRTSTGTAGTIDIIRGVGGGNPGVSGNNVVLTINFKVIGTSGNIPLALTTASEVYDDTGSGNNIIDMQSTTGANYAFAVTTSPIFRFYSPLLRHHLLTADSNEANSIKANYPASVWTYEGVAFKVKGTSGCAAGESVYRFYSEVLKTHLYTMDENEKATIISRYPPSVWRYEGTGYCADPTQVAGTQPVYRFYSEVVKSHLYTIDPNEKSSIIANFPSTVWRYEGIAYYAYPN